MPIYITLFTVRITVHHLGNQLLISQLIMHQFKTNPISRLCFLLHFLTEISLKNSTNNLIIQTVQILYNHALNKKTH